tara:strand:+ start:364 stop:645 length:282 start_codon:yes stop_codon:yes gene_type:complete
METGSVNLWEDCVQCDTDTQKINHLAKLLVTRKSEMDILTSKDVCKILDIGLNTLDNYVSQGLIEYSKTQRKRYFYRRSVNAYLDKLRVRARD